MTRSRAAFIFIFITVLLDMVSFGVIIPVFPQLILRLQGGDMAGAAAIFGILGTAFAVMQVIFAPVQGALSDRYGRRPVILLSNLGLGVDYVVMAVAPPLPLSFANFLYGLLILPESLPPERRGPFRLRAANPIGAMRFLGLRPVLFTLGAVAFFGNLGHDALPNTFVLYATQRFNFDERAIGLSLAIVGVSSLIVQGFVVGRAVAALGEYRALLAGLGLGIAAELLLGLAPTSA